MATTSRRSVTCHSKGAARTVLANRQPWDFVVVTSREQLARPAKVWERGGKHIAGSAATIALVAQEPEDQRHWDWLLYDFGQATAFMMLAAADLGIGSGHSSVADQRQAQRVLGFPDGYRAVYLIGLGCPAAGRCSRSAGPTADPSTRSCTGTIGNTPKAQFRPIWPLHDPLLDAWRRPDLHERALDGRIFMR